MLVILSVWDEPESVAVVRSGADGAAAKVSMVPLRPEDARLVLPATSVCLAVRLWTPSARVELVIDQFPEPSATPVPSTVAPSYRVTVAPASAPLPVNIGAATLVML